MKTIPLTAFALGIVASIMLSQPSFAFHDSALDPAIKQHLARAIEMLESRCASGGKSACLLKERIRTLGNDLERATQACRAGDQTACQTVARARNLQNSVQQGSATPNQQPGSVTRNPYDWRTYERGPIGNPYDWRNYPEYDTSRPIGNPYDWRNYERDIVIGNPYDWRNYGKIK